MSESKGPAGTALLDEAMSETGRGKHVAHLVLKPDWPIALCGASVSEHLGTSAPALDRCVDCLKIAAQRGLGRPGWGSV